MIDISIVIVNYNGRELLLQTLSSIYRTVETLIVEVFVVDNASSDGSTSIVSEMFPSVELICNKSNVGFAKANNQALKLCSGEYILVLNSDTVLQPDTLSTMIDFMERHPRAGAAGCKIVKHNGDLDLACRRSFPTPFNALCHIIKLDKFFPRNRKIASYNLTYLDPEGTYDVDCLVGAFMFLRRETMEEVGLLDEQFFMYGEDIDWCYRIKELHSWEIWYTGKTHILHYKGSSSNKSLKLTYEFYRAMHIYYKKHFSRQAPVLVQMAVTLGIACAFIVTYLARKVTSVLRLRWMTNILRLTRKP